MFVFLNHAITATNYEHLSFFKIKLVFLSNLNISEFMEPFCIFGITAKNPYRPKIVRAIAFITQLCFRKSTNKFILSSFDISSNQIVSGSDLIILE